MASAKFTRAGTRLILSTLKPGVAQGAVPSSCNHAVRHFSARYRPNLTSTSRLLAAGTASRGSVASIRHASTSTASAPAAGDAISSSPDTFSTPLDTIDQLYSHADTIEPHLGYMKELGLDYGWGPTSLVQTILEGIQVSSGLPMIGAITLSVIATRILLLPFFFRSSDMAARMAVLSPVLRPLTDRMRAAQLEGDTAKSMAARSEMKTVYQKGGIKMGSVFLPMALQLPLGFGMFRLTGGMARLPFPGLDEAGLGWFTNLTVSDPFFILPLMTSGVIYFTLKKGGESGESTMANPAMRSFLQNGMPVLSLLFTSWLPAVTQVSFFVTSLWGFFQSTIIRSERVRNALRIHPFPKNKGVAAKATDQPAYKGTLTRDNAPAIEPEPEKKSGIASTVSNTVEKVRTGPANMRKKIQETVSRQQGKKHSRFTDSEVKSAQAYENKKQKQEKIDQERREEREKVERLRHLNRR